MIFQKLLEMFNTCGLIPSRYSPRTTTVGMRERDYACKAIGKREECSPQTYQFISIALSLTDWRRRLWNTSKGTVMEREPNKRDQQTKQRNK